MTLDNRTSAVSRCPVELWGMILRFATYVPRAYPSEALIDDFQVCGGVIRSNVDVMYARRSESVAWMRDLLSVCRAWRSLVYPLLLEWIMIGDRRTLEGVLRLLVGSEPFEGRSRGSFVRRLEIRDFEIVHPDPEDEPDYYEEVSSGKWEMPAVQILEACPRLEELFLDTSFSMRYASLLSTLVRLYRPTLSLLEIRAAGLLTTDCVEPMASLITSPHIVSLDMKMMLYFMGGVPMPNTRDYSMRSLALQSLSWEVAYDCCWLRSFASLDLPCLQHLHVHLSLPRSFPPQPDRIRTEDDLPSGLSFFLQTHGHKLKSFSVSFQGSHPWERDEGVTFALLKWCSHLEELAINFAGSSIITLAFPQKFLRRITCHGLFGRHFHAETLSDYEARVRQALRVLEACCGPDFPNLKTLRFLDFISPTPQLPSVKSTWEQIRDAYQPYLQFLKTAQQVCAAAHVRLEDCVGQVLHNDCVPRWLVHADEEGSASGDEEESEEASGDGGSGEDEDFEEDEVTAERGTAEEDQALEDESDIGCSG